MTDRGRLPLIVQGDRTILLEVGSPGASEARDAIAPFAELVKSPEHVHTFRITPLSVWNASAAGLSPDVMLETLERWSKYEVPGNVRTDLLAWGMRYGRLRLEREGEDLLLTSDDPVLLEGIARSKTVIPFLAGAVGPRAVRVDDRWRGHLKQALIRLQWPVEDLAGYRPGTPLEIALSPSLDSGRPFALRPYQVDAVDAFHAGGTSKGGSGVVVLPCGAGKTVVGIGAMARLSTATLVLTTSNSAVKQWLRELLEKTDLTPEQVGEYTGETKQTRPVTITTYQIVTYRPRTSSRFPHFDVFEALDWGLIIYDEVHLLPAPVFRVTAELQARRRLGLTATLVREDGREDEVFSLIGPKRHDVPWKVLERQGWIATAICREVRTPLPDERRMDYAMSGDRSRFRIASENPVKLRLLESLVARHRGDRILVIGQYLDQLHAAQRVLGAPLITGATPTADREDLYARFRRGDVDILILSRVGNFAIDLPDANVAIQISGTFGSRQEEAQRLGRILRPKTDGATAHFYSLVSRDTCEQDFAQNRQLFLTEQGYRYEILDADDFLPPSDAPPDVPEDTATPPPA